MIGAKNLIKSEGVKRHEKGSRDNEGRSGDHCHVVAIQSDQPIGLCWHGLMLA